MSKLLRILGLTFGIAVTVGNTIGAGILRAPGDVAASLPSFWPFVLVWIAGALYAFLGANALGELATMLPYSGGQYVYARRALGGYAGFIVGWSDWLSTCGSITAVALVIGEYSAYLLPPLAGQRLPIALAVIVLFALVQWRGVVWGSRTQQLTTLLKAIAFLILIVACLSLGRRPMTEMVSEIHPQQTALFLAWILALQGVIFTYDGWSGVVYFSEEVRDSRRDIPRSLFGSLTLITAIYLLLNLGFLRVVPISDIAGESMAAGVVAQRLFGLYGDTILRSLVVVAMLSGINAFYLMATRVLFGMGRDRLFTRRAEAVNAGGTPTVALLISALVAVLFLLTGTFQKAIALLSFFFVANYTLSFLSLFVLRLTEPNMTRPYRAWGHPWTTGAALLCSVAFLAGAILSDTRNSIYALVLLAVSYPLYRGVKLVT